MILYTRLRRSCIHIYSPTRIRYEIVTWLSGYLSLLLFMNFCPRVLVLLCVLLLLIYDDYEKRIYIHILVRDFLSLHLILKCNDLQELVSSIYGIYYYRIKFW